MTNISPPKGSILQVIDGLLLVDNKAFSVTCPDEKIHTVEDNKLVTLFRGHLHNYWEHDEIKGYYI